MTCTKKDVEIAHPGIVAKTGNPRNWSRKPEIHQEEPPNNSQLQKNYGRATSAALQAQFGQGSQRV
jgi:hypothetical protein